MNQLIPGKLPGNWEYNIGKNLHYCLPGFNHLFYLFDILPVLILLQHMLRDIMKRIEDLPIFTWNALSLVRIVKSVYVPSFLICQKFSACLEENVSVRRNGNASAAAMSEGNTVKINDFSLCYKLSYSLLRSAIIRE